MIDHSLQCSGSGRVSGVGEEYTVAVAVGSGVSVAVGCGVVVTVGLGVAVTLGGFSVDRLSAGLEGWKNSSVFPKGGSVEDATDVAEQLARNSIPNRIATKENNEPCKYFIRASSLGIIFDIRKFKLIRCEYLMSQPETSIHPG
jgi:hypothetical protein